MSLTKYKPAPLVVIFAACTLFVDGALSGEKSETQPGPNTDRLTDANFQTIYDELQPPKVEPWKSIPWHISIVEAAKQAEKEGKPVFMWQADGWPLGCG